MFLLEYDRWNLALGAVIGFATAQRVAFRVLPNFDAWSTKPTMSMPLLPKQRRSHCTNKP